MSVNTNTNPNMGPGNPEVNISRTSEENVSEVSQGNFEEESEENKESINKDSNLNPSETPDEAKSLGVSNNNPSKNKHRYSLRKMPRRNYTESFKDDVIDDAHLQL